MNKKKMSFWNERANNAIHPGSDDFILKKIEINYINKHIQDGMKILDIGCGDGSTIFEIEKNKNITGIGLDFSSSMIEKALKNQNNESSTIEFKQKSVLDISKQEFGEFDVVYTQRCLINLDSFDEQKKAIENIKNVLKNGGLYIMVESTVDGLNEINLLRSLLELEIILPPWHNTFFDIKEVHKLQTDDFKIIDFENISSTYSFLSRVVYAKIATQNNEEMRYDSEINMVATKLPQNIGNFGPVKGFIWQKGH